jgi:hypothetical protein
MLTTLRKLHGWIEIDTAETHGVASYSPQLAYPRGFALHCETGYFSDDESYIHGTTV